MTLIRIRCQRFWTGAKNYKQITAFALREKYNLCAIAQMVQHPSMPCEQLSNKRNLSYHKLDDNYMLLNKCYKLFMVLP